MRVKLSDSAYKHILSDTWVSARADEALLAWLVNRAFASVGEPPFFEIDDTDISADDEALVILVPVSNGRGEDAALRILYPEVDFKLVDNFYEGDVRAVHRKKDGRLLGFFTTYYRNGWLAEQKFDPAPGVRVYYDD
jgi:hypothetical protein